MGMKEDFRSLADRFSYCSSLQVLYTFLLHTSNDHEVNFQLKKAAAYATSRKKLKEMMEELAVGSLQLAVGSSELGRGIGTPEPEVSGERESDRWPEPNLTGGRYQLREVVRKRLAEIEAEKRGGVPKVKSEPTPIKTEPTVSTKEDILSQEEYKPGQEISEKTDNLKSDLLSKEEIVEKFIREEPRITPARASFFTPAEYAVRSNIDDGEIVSETLALLYLKQGNNAKARMVYEKLSLLFPEKSSYFAAQIEKTNDK
jgi:hypothetical protein